MSQTIAKNVTIHCKHEGDRTYECVAEIFHDVKEAIDVTESRPLNYGCGEHDDMITNRNYLHKSFHGVKSYEEFRDLALNGYSCDLSEALKGEMKIQMRNTQVEKRTERFNDVVGYTPNVPLAIAGVPMSMVNSRTRVIKKKCINVMIDVAIPARISTETATECYKQVLRNIIGLEANGYAVRLTAMSSFADEYRAYALAVRIKNEGQRFNMKSMSYPLAHPSFERMLAFSWYSRHPKTRYMLGCGCALYHEAKGEFKPADLVRGIFGRDVSYISIAKMADMKLVSDRAKYLNECLQR